MPKLAVFGGKAVTKDLLGESQLKFRPDLERKYVLEVLDKGPGDDWPWGKSMAAKFASEFSQFQTARYCALLTNGTHALQVALETLDVGCGDEVIVPGLTWNGRGSGSLGDLGAFSFQSSKTMRSFEGGALVMNKEDYYWKVVSQRACGREFKAGLKVHSGNYRITSLQAALLRGQLAAMKRNASIFDRNGQALDEAVAAAPGVKPLRRHRHITRQTGYCFGFLYEPEQFDGLSGEVFRKALSAELHWGFGTTYTPLNHSELYYPHTKKRYQLSKQYVKAITPSRWELPVAEGLWKDRAVISGWAIYGLAPSRAHLLTEAIAKICEHRHELLAGERTK